MDRRIAFVVVASVLLLAHATSAQRAPGTSHSQLGTAAVPGQSSRSHTPTPPPPPQPPPVASQLPARSNVRTLPPSPPGLIPSGITQLPSNGVFQTFMPAGINARFGGRFVDGRFVDGRTIDPRFANDVFRANRYTYAPRYGNRLDGGYGGYGSIGGGYYDSSVGTGFPQTDLRGEAPAEFGYLRLSVQPDAAQIYIDGFYVSTAGSFAGGGPARAIEAGPHRIEIRADGYETTTFDVRVMPNETTTYSRDLTRTEEPRQARNVPPAVPKTFYVIPKCYAGDRPPEADKLPKGCLASNVRKIPPILNDARKAL